MEYPNHHRQIVEDLMNGRFILAKEKHFEELRENEIFYSRFFEASFGYELILTQEYAYIISNDTNEMLSRDISIFFAILCYELDKEGKNFSDQLAYQEFTTAAIDRLFENSSYADLVRSNNQLKDAERRKNLINAMSRRNIVEKVTEDKFFFTPAYKIFIEFAKDLATVNKY